MIEYGKVQYPNAYKKISGFMHRWLTFTHPNIHRIHISNTKYDGQSCFVISEVYDKIERENRGPRQKIIRKTAWGQVSCKMAITEAIKEIPGESIEDHELMILITGVIPDPEMFKELIEEYHAYIIYLVVDNNEAIFKPYKRFALRASLDSPIGGYYVDGASPAVAPMLSRLFEDLYYGKHAKLIIDETESSVWDSETSIFANFVGHYYNDDLEWSCSEMRECGQPLLNYIMWCAYDSLHTPTTAADGTIEEYINAMTDKLIKGERAIAKDDDPKIINTMGAVFTDLQEEFDYVVKNMVNMSAGNWVDIIKFPPVQTIDGVACQFPNIQTHAPFVCGIVVDPTSIRRSFKHYKIVSNRILRDSQGKVDIFIKVDVISRSIRLRSLPNGINVYRIVKGYDGFGTSTDAWFEPPTMQTKG